MACLLALLATAGTVFAAPPEVRILVDVSGSMRRNDPQNLRIPALRLVNELLPDGASAGIWLFAEKPEILAPPGKVDQKWKTRTGARLERVHSRGLFTDIEQAIAAAIAGWDAATEASDRHLVLLTDGLVDVSREADKSAASRERIVSTQLERLKALHVKVHAIALSDEVDAELMRLLTSQTDGWLESAKDADTLQRVFLHMMEQAAAPTTVPLEGNRFEIDDQVSEFTLLAFRGAEGATTLVSPDGVTISATQQPAGAIWRTEAGYDLVTLTKPQPGQWQLQGVEDPDNRVVVVTDLGIALTPLPSALRHGEILRIEAWLTDHQEPVTHSDLLRLLTAKAMLTPIAETIQPQEEGAGQTPLQEAGENRQPLELALELDPESGRYRGGLETPSLAPGVYQLQVTLDGGTFKRQAAKRIKLVGSPVTIRYAQQLPSEATPAAALIPTLDAEPDLIDPSSLSGYLLMRGPKGNDSVIDIPKTKTLPLVLTIPVKMPGDYQIQGRLLARTLTGEIIDIEPEPKHLVFEFDASSLLAHDDSEQDVAGQSISWIELSVYVLVGNAILSLLLGLTWWWLHRSRNSIVAVKAKQTSGQPA